MNSPITIDGSSYVCPGCNNTNTILTGAQALYIGCATCRAYYKREGNGLKFLQQPAIKNGIGKVAYLRPGDKGELFGVKWTVVGFAAKREKNTIYAWGEYTLFNPKDNSYAFLSEYEGNWIFFKETTDKPKRNKQRTFVHNDKTWSLYSDYKSSFDYGFGEFPEDVSNLINKRTIEYICPPEMLAIETGDTSIWLHGQYVSAKDITAAFQPKSMPVRSSIGPVHPVPYNGKADKLKGFLMKCLVVLVILSLVFSFGYHKETPVYSQQFILDTFGFQNPVLVSQPFIVKGEFENLEIKMIADVDNSWMEGDFTLVNDNTDEEFYFTMGVEYYHGYTGGENWAEGSTAESKILSSIPAGTYHINITPYRPEASRNALTTIADSITYTINYSPSIPVPRILEIHVTRDVSTPSNFWMFGLVLGIILIIISVHGYAINYGRWSNSNFSPYDHE